MRPADDTDPVVLKLRLTGLEARFRATQTVGALILIVVSLTAPAVVSIDDSTGDDYRTTKGIWAGIKLANKLAGNPDADFGSHGSHMVVFGGLLVTVILCLLMLPAALMAFLPEAVGPRSLWSGLCIAVAVAPVVTLVGLGMSSGQSELAATWTTLAPSGLGLWTLASLPPR